MSIDLEYKAIDNLTPLMPILGRFSKLKELNLHGNRLKALPDDLSILRQLESLDISNNMFTDIAQVAAALSTLPNLVNLNYQAQTMEEEVFLMNSLKNLEYYNNRRKRLDGFYDKS